jgi:hypothetical protein
MGIGALAQGFATGYGLGLQGQRTKRVNELNDLKIEEANTRKAEKGLVDEAMSGALSQQAAPIIDRGTGGTTTGVIGGADVSGLQPSEPTTTKGNAPSRLDYYQGGMANIRSAMSDPKYRAVIPQLMGKMKELSDMADTDNDFIHKEAVQKSWPHIKALSDPATPDDVKSAAASALASDVYPDGRQHRVSIAGDMATFLDEDGKPLMDGDKPRQISVADILDGATNALESPKTFMESRRAAINELRAEAKANKLLDKQQGFIRTENEKNRTAQSERYGLEDKRASATAARDAAKDTLANRRAAAAYIQTGMNSFEKDERAKMTADPTAFKPDTAGRDALRKSLMQQAAGIYGIDLSGAMGPQGPAPRTMPAAGETFDVEIGGSLSAAPTSAKPAAAAVPVPVPNSSTQGAGLAPRQFAVPSTTQLAPSDVSVGIESAKRAIGGAVSTAMNPAPASKTRDIAGQINVLRNDNQPLKEGDARLGKIRFLALQKDDELLAAGVSKEEIQAIRDSARIFRLGAQ